MENIQVFSLSIGLSFLNPLILSQHIRDLDASSHFSMLLNITDLQFLSVFDIYRLGFVFHHFSVMSVFSCFIVFLSELISLVFQVFCFPDLYVQAACQEFRFWEHQWSPQVLTVFNVITSGFFIFLDVFEFLLFCHDVYFQCSITDIAVCANASFCK